MSRTVRMSVHLATAVLGLWILATEAASAQDAIRTYQIAEQPLGQALREFALANHLDLLFSPDLVAGRTSVKLDGRFTVDDGLRTLLRGSGLEFSVSGSRIVISESKSAPAREAIAPATSTTNGTNGYTRLAAENPSSQGPSPTPSGGARAASIDAPSERAPARLELEEVIVTAQKRREPLQDVPLSVTAITAQDIRERGYTNYADYLYAVPGVFFIDQGPGLSNIQIRGLAADESGAASTVTTYFGETVTSARTSFGGKPNPRLVDIERVEVLRGPQGTLFGANSLAGVVRIIPASPNFDHFELHLGTRGFSTAHSGDASYHVEGVVNVPLIHDRLALRLVGYKDDIAGYVDNIFPGQAAVDYSARFAAPAGTFVTPAIPAFTDKDNNSREISGGRAALSWQATNRLRLDLNYVRQDDRLDGDSTTLPAAGLYAEPRAMDVFKPSKQSERLTIGTVVLNYDWDAVSLISASNWTERRRINNQDLTFLATLNPQVLAPVPWLLFDRSKGKLFTQEVRVQSRGESALQWTVGGFYFEQSATANQFVADFSCPACLPLVLLNQDFAFAFGPAKFVEQRQRSVFGDVSYQFLPRWTAGVGLRYLEETLTNFSPATTGLLVGGAQPEKPSVSGTVYETNPSAYVRFEPTPNITLYLQAARGFRSGDVNQPIPANCQAQAGALGLKQLTDPDTLWSYELGFKSTLANGRLAINADVYKLKWKGVQLTTLLTCGFQQGFNGGDVDGQGAELELQAHLTPSWRLNLAASYNRNEFDRVAPATIAGNLFAVGERVPNAPQKNGSAGLQYDFPLSTPWSLFARADYVYVGDLRLKLATTASQSAFHSANVRIGAQRDNFAVDLFGNNVTDERAVVGTGLTTAGTVETLLRPREIGIELRYSFR